MFRAVLCLISLVLAGLKAPLAAEPGPIPMTPAQAKQTGIVTQPLKALGTQDGHTLPAQVVIDPRRLEVLAAPLSGTLTAVRVLAGQTVRKGMALGRFQGAPLLALQREFIEARGQAELAAETRKRDETLFAEGIVAQARLQQTQAMARAASALLNEKRQSLRLAGLPEPGPANADGFSGTVELRAPFDGVVLEAPAQPGQRFEASAPLFKLGRLDALALEIQASPLLAAGVRPGDAVEVPGCTTPARVLAVAPNLNSSQAVLVRADLPQRGTPCVRPYQNLQVRLHPSGDHHQDGWILPSQALVRHQGQSWVFTGEAGGYRPVAVRVLDEAEQTVRIAPGLPGEMAVVVKGTATLKAAWLGLGAPEGK